MPKLSVRKILSRIFIAAGAVLIAATVGLEICRFPFGALLGWEKSADELPSPAPIVLESDDAESIVVRATVQPDKDVYADAKAETETETETETSNSNSTLPGNAKDNTPQPVYTQLGVIKIAKLNVSKYVLEGTQRQMRYGAGHVTGTAAIGEQGNCSIAGHNTTLFRYLNLLGSGDTVVLEANGKKFTYTVYDAFKVLPDETWVLSTIADEDYALTLITCTPYPSSSHRLIVRARLTEIDGTAVA